MENEQTAPEQNFLEDTSAYQTFEYATTGQRFVNFLIDNLLMRFGLNYLTGFLLGMFLGTFFPEFIMKIRIGESKTELYILVFILLILNYLIYYTFCEKLFKGYTLGKLISGTRAVREDLTELEFKDAFLRSLCRLTPFEVFSGLKIRPWHDEWTRTMVIKTR